MEEVGIFVFGQTQEQVESGYNYTSEENKVFYSKLREFLYEHSLRKDKFLNLYTTSERGLGFTAITAGISLKNQYEQLIPLVSIKTISSDRMSEWTYKQVQRYSELVNLVDSSRVIKVNEAHSKNELKNNVRDSWVKAGIAMAKECEIGIIATPTKKLDYISEVMRYAFNSKKKVYRYNEETKEFNEVTLVDMMLY